MKTPQVSEQDVRLIAELITAQTNEQSTVPQAEQRPPATTKPTPHAPTRQRAASTPADAPLYNRVQSTIALCFAIFIAGLLWWFGAYFTLQALASFGIKLAGVGWWQWLIPVAITASELALWPHRASGPLQFLFFAGVGLFDIGTSFAGLTVWGAGRPIPLFVGFTIPQAGWGLVGFALVVALVLAFIPERLIRWAGPDLLALWK
jgi:hypothetical protein